MISSVFKLKSSYSIVRGVCKKCNGIEGMGKVDIEIGRAHV